MAFQDGQLLYETATLVSPSDLSEDRGLQSEWNDGYAAFSRGEVRLTGVPNIKVPDLSNEKVSGVNGVEGYLMELNLWRHDGEGIFEEIIIEREDGGYFCQYWKLNTKSTTRETNCYYRQAETFPRKTIGGRKPLFADNEMRSLECIVPEHRLHFFITTGKQT